MIQDFPPLKAEAHWVKFPVLTAFRTCCVWASPLSVKPFPGGTWPCTKHSAEGSASQQLPLKHNLQNVPDHVQQTRISLNNSSYIAAKAFIFFLAVIFSSFFSFPVCCVAGLKVNIRLSHCQNRNISALVSLKISRGVKRWMPSFKVEWIFIAKL